MLCFLQLHCLASGQLSSQFPAEDPSASQRTPCAGGDLIVAHTSGLLPIMVCPWGLRELHGFHPIPPCLLPQLDILGRETCHITHPCPKSLLRKPSGGTRTEPEPPAANTAPCAKCFQHLVSVSHVSTPLLTWPELTEVS